MIKNQLKNSLTFIAALAVVGLLTPIAGCKKTPAPASPTTPAAPAVAQKPIQKAVSSAVKITPPSTANQFDFSTKKDPFKPFVMARKAAALTPEEQKKALRDSLPIHSFDVSQFKLIGVVTGAKDNQAMVVDPNGKGYVLKVGMTIGKNEGRVTAITASGIDVLEQFKDDSGRVRKENIKITLPRKQ